MGLPSNIPPPPAHLFGPATTPTPNPFEAPAPSTTPEPPRAANPFEVASTIPLMNPFDQPAPSTVRMNQSPSVTPSDDGGVEIVINAPAAQDPMFLTADDTHSDEPCAPSRQDLLQRAAQMGPSRMTWESIVLQPTDPILGEKMQPRVAERRARFRKVVKVALGACVAFCLVATAATALSSSGTSSKAAAVSKTAPAAAVVPVEKLELTPLTKVSNQQHAVTAAARPTPSPALKKRR